MSELLELKKQLNKLTRAYKTFSGPPASGMLYERAIKNLMNQIKEMEAEK